MRVPNVVCEISLRRFFRQRQTTPWPTKWHRQQQIKGDNQPTKWDRLRQIEGDNQHYRARKIIWINLVMFRYSSWTKRSSNPRLFHQRFSHKREKSYWYLKCVVSGDEKWIIYTQTTSKAVLHPSKIMFSIWWDWKDVVFCELLLRNRTIISDVYCNQPDKLNATVYEKHPKLVNRGGVVFHHDGARPQSSLLKLLGLDWDVLPHPPYFPHILPSDYHVLHSLKNSLNGKLKHLSWNILAEKGSLNEELWSYPKDGKR